MSNIFDKLRAYKNKFKEDSDGVFRKKVEKIMKKEKDFSSLYDYNKMKNMSEREELEYMYELTKKYVETKQALINDRLA